jgi:hypothetical protein
VNPSRLAKIAALAEAFKLMEDKDMREKVIKAIAQV